MQYPALSSPHPAAVYLSGPETTCEAAARLLFMSVKWTKNVPAFVALPPADQARLLHDGWRELFLLGAAQFCMPVDERQLLAAAGTGAHRGTQGHTRACTRGHAHAGMHTRACTRGHAHAGMHTREHAGTLGHARPHGTHADTQGQTVAHGGTREHTRAHRGTRGHTRAHAGTRGHTRAYADTRGHTGAHGGIRGHTGAHGGTHGHTRAVAGIVVPKNG